MTRIRQLCELSNLRISVSNKKKELSMIKAFKINLLCPNCIIRNKQHNKKLLFSFHLDLLFSQLLSTLRLIILGLYGVFIG